MGSREVMEEVSAVAIDRAARLSLAPAGPPAALPTNGVGRGAAHLARE